MKIADMRQSAFTALNIEPESDDDEEVDDSKEIQARNSNQ